VKFEIDDAEQTWTWPSNFFDLVHLRTMTGCIRDWDKLFTQAFQSVHPHVIPSPPLPSLALPSLLSLPPLPPGLTYLQRHTKPGGFIELQEMDYMGVIQPTSRVPGTSFTTWCTEQGIAARKAGVILRTSSSLLVSSLQKVGFVDCQVHEFKLPIGPWPREKRLRNAGLLQLSAMLEGIEGLSLRLFTHYAGWSLDELKVLLAKVRTELRDSGCHAYWPV
jgi:hypothetical protein